MLPHRAVDLTVRPEKGFSAAFSQVIGLPGVFVEMTTPLGLGPMSADTFARVERE
jgi:hypothetical protein